MKDRNFLFYTDYFKNKNISNKSVLVAKTKNSILVGPLLNKHFDEYSFCKRIASNCIYRKSIYKKIYSKKRLKIIDCYKNELKDNEVIEIFSNGLIQNHKIIKVPRDINEKKQVDIK